MSIDSCIPIIPSFDLRKSLRLWVDVLGFVVETDMEKNDEIVFCMLRKNKMSLMLNRRIGDASNPENYEGIRLYWTPTDLEEIRNKLMEFGYQVSEIVNRDYGQKEFFFTDDDGFSHCFGVSENA